MVKELIKNINATIKKNLISAIKFGSEGELNNLVLVFDTLKFETLQEIKPEIIKYQKKHKLVPLMFTKEELLDGTDVFPLDFLDIKYPSTTIYGENLIEQIKIKKTHVRQQIEFELRSKLIHLRSNFIGIKNKDELKNMIHGAIPTLMPLFYGLLFLKNIQTPTKLNKLFDLVAQNYQINLTILKKIKQARDKKIKIKNNELDTYISELINLLSELGQKIDKLKVN